MPIRVFGLVLQFQCPGHERQDLSTREGPQAVDYRAHQRLAVGESRRRGVLLRRLDGHHRHGVVQRQAGQQLGPVQRHLKITQFIYEPDVQRLPAGPNWLDLMIQPERGQCDSEEYR